MHDLFILFYSMQYIFMADSVDIGECVCECEYTVEFIDVFECLLEPVEWIRGIFSLIHVQWIFFLLFFWFCLCRWCSFTVYCSTSFTNTQRIIRISNDIVFYIRKTNITIFEKKQSEHTKRKKSNFKTAYKIRSIAEQIISGLDRVKERDRILWTVRALRIIIYGNKRKKIVRNKDCFTFSIEISFF